MISLVLTVIADDKPGIVDLLASVVADHGANWEESRMARLAGQFAGILRVHVEDDAADGLVTDLRGLEGQGLTLVIQRTAEGIAARTKLVPMTVNLDGADHPGLIHALSRALSALRINVDALETTCRQAPMTGAPIFEAHAELRAPADLDVDAFRSTVEQLAADLEVDIELL